MRKVEVDDMCDDGQVKPTAKRPRGNQHLALALRKQLQVVPSLLRNKLTVDAGGGDGRRNEMLDEEVGARARVDEDDDAALAHGVLLAVQRVPVADVRDVRGW